jgi:magnesium transporter
MMNPEKDLKNQAKRQIGKIKKIARPKAKKIGLAPGTLIYTGEKPELPVKISVIDYFGEYFSEKEVNNVEEVFSLKKTDSKSWINIDGIHHLKTIEAIGNNFDVHPLVLEDILHTSQRPKLEDYSKYIFIVLRMFIFNEETLEIKNEQVSFILGENYLITFQEDIGDVFDSVRDRLRKGGPKIRNGDIDYLAYALIDAVVDSYFHILEKIGEDIEELEDRLVANPDRDDLQKVHQLKRGLILLRKSVWPLREVLSQMQRNENGMIQKETEIYIRDVYDHTIQVIDTIESYRDMVVGMLDVFLSSLSNKMNEVMKVLTIIATVFIPLTFLAGVYGMNFEHFPELHWEWMYPWGFWIFTFLAIGTMLWLFKRKKWM